MKKLFGTVTRTILTLIVIIVVIAAITTIAVLKTSLLSKAEAKEIVLEDAGVYPSAIQNYDADLDFENGHFQYAIEFYSNGSEYEYTILAKNGEILNRNIPATAPSSNTAVEDASDTPSDSSDKNTSSQEQESSGQNAELSLEDAKALALADANVTEENVTFLKAKLDAHDPVPSYDIEFYTVDAEYDYEINATDGTIISRDVHTFDSSDTANKNTSDAYIGVDKAKETALQHAELSASDVVFSKAKLENDNGKMEYEIEFYYGDTEYEYSIDANSGSILEYDTDRR